MDLETLGVLLIIAVIVGLLSRAFIGYSLQGCLITYILACLGAVGGWIIQRQYFGLDQLLVLPIPEDSKPVSVLGGTIGALLISILGSLILRPAPQLRRRRYRR